VGRTLRFLTGIDLLIPALDVAYALVWLPGLVLAATGRYWIVGPYTVAVLPPPPLEMTRRASSR
jgi:poly-beta-1,6-N-acetyl-D-glucosamine synthase